MEIELSNLEKKYNIASEEENKNINNKIFKLNLEILIIKLLLLECD